MHLLHLRFLYLLFDCDALFNIPLSPDKAKIVTPAKINKTIIVITSATSVIPFFHYFSF